MSSDDVDLYIVDGSSNDERRLKHLLRDLVQDD